MGQLAGLMCNFLGDEPEVASEDIDEAWIGF